MGEWSFPQRERNREPFFVFCGATCSMFPMMRKTDKNFGYARHEGFTAKSVTDASKRSHSLLFSFLTPLMGCPRSNRN